MIADIIYPLKQKHCNHRRQKEIKMKKKIKFSGYVMAALLAGVLLITPAMAGDQGHENMDRKKMMDHDKMMDQKGMDHDKMMDQKGMDHDKMMDHKGMDHDKMKDHKKKNHKKKHKH